MIERLRSANNEPVGVESCYLWFPGCEAVLQADLSGSLYQLLREQYDLIPTWADESIEAGACPAWAAKVLGVCRGAPALLITRTTYTQARQPFEYVESVYRSDRYVFHINLSVDSGE